MREFSYEKNPASDNLPTVRKEDVEAAIVSCTYQRVVTEAGEPTTTTVCALVLDNGHVVVGSSGCVVAEKYDFGIGADIAREAAEDKVWQLLGYELRLKLLAAG